MENKKFRVLIVEDNSSYRKLLKETLQKPFPTLAVDEATDGREAFQKVNVFSPDLIFMDIRLPGENGLELTRKIKASHPIVVFVITSYGAPEYQKPLLKAEPIVFCPRIP